MKADVRDGILFLLFMLAVGGVVLTFLCMAVELVLLLVFGISL